MNKARRELVQKLRESDPALSPKDAYFLTRKVKFTGPLKDKLAAKGLDVSKRRMFTPEEFGIVQQTIEEMLAEAKAKAAEEAQNANPNS